MTPLLSAIDVTVHYPSRPDPAIDSISLDVVEGATLGIVGESGSGKSTLARVLVGSIQPSAGTVLVGGVEWATIGRRHEARRRVQMIFQDPYAALNPSLTAIQAVAEVVRVWKGASARHARSEAEAILGEVGLQEEAFGRRPTRLSGGQCQRIGIARALACEPSVLIADEPTSSLDVSAQAQVLNLLKGLQSSRGLALVFVSHDLGVVEYLADETLVMLSGHVVERADTAQLFAAPQHEYTKQLINASMGMRARPSAPPSVEPR